LNITGKSHSAELVAKALELDFYSLSVGEQSTKSDLLGFIDANGNYRNTAFRKAFEMGGLFLLDEIDAGNPNVLLSINTGISNGFIDFPDCQITVHKDFTLVATANTFGRGASEGYLGRNSLDLATVNRFIPILWELDEDIEEALVDHPQWIKVARKARELADDSLDGVLIGMRNSLYGADMLRQGIDFEDVFKMAICNGLGEDDIQVLNEAKKLWKTKKVETETYESDYEEPTESDEFSF